eukprot:GHVU01022343.1.p2 GENE.GHVU01022343.1~~GHVU01022343.1.p2  ORF type:complete len:127 (+),score=13.47 GHVU01022343.1:586-966(+)
METLAALKASDADDAMLEKLVLVASQNLKKYWYTGRCRRDYTGCPPTVCFNICTNALRRTVSTLSLQWTTTAGMCIPPTGWTRRGNKQLQKGSLTSTIFRLFWTLRTSEHSERKFGAEGGGFMALR